MLISVIVPVYNVEQYLDRCIDSIVNQTYTNLEIILVDDGSTDRSKDICDEWKKKDKRIKVIHKENGGLSDARNVGLDNATGEYIGFVDSDDYINANTYEILISMIIRTNTDIVECNWIKVDDTINIRTDIEYKNYKVYSPQDAIKELMKDGEFRQTVVNKLYKREIISNLVFPVTKINEDEFWTYKVFGNANKLCKVQSVLYYYYQRENSIINSSFTIQRLDALEAKKERFKYINKYYPSIKYEAKWSYISSCMGFYQRLTKHKNLDMNNEYRKKIHTDYVEMFNLLECKEPLKQKIWYELFYFFPNFTANIRNCFGIGK